MTAPWVTTADLPTPLPTLPGGEAEWGAVILLASEVLWSLSGRRFGGVTTRTVEVAAPAAGDGEPGPRLLDGQVVNGACGRPAAVRLPGDPADVITVEVGGVIRDPGSYRLDGGYLLDLSGRGWPTALPGAVVTYLDGRNPPEGGRQAAALLAVEFGKARAGDPTCGLPGNVTSLTRQGITQTMVAASQVIAAGQVGLGPVDTWLATVNPARLPRRARAWSPDTHPVTVRRTT